MKTTDTTRRDFLKLLGCGALAAAGPAAAKPKDKRPNIVLILADDMGWSDLGCYGGEVETPNLDRLAKGGIRFTQFHNTAKCFPSRACLLTGLYAQQCGMGRSPGTLTHCVTLGEVLRAAGYRTLMTGKHHGKENPATRGFDRYFGLRDGCCNYFNPGRQREGEGKPAQKRANRAWCVEDKTHTPYTPKEKDFYTTDYFTKYALKYLDEYKDPSTGSGQAKPFFLYLAYTAPHDPLMAWPDDIAKYRGKYLVGYEKIRAARYKRQIDMGLADKNSPLSKPTFKPWASLSDQKRKQEDLTMAVYAAMIDRMDQNIGKVLAKIEALGAADNTLVLFASDNGCSAEMVGIGGTGEIGTMTRWTSLGRNWANVSDTPYRYFKNYSHEGGICTPLIAYWPAGITDPGRISHHVGHFIDFMATFVDVGGAKYPAQFDGRKIVPLEGESLRGVFQSKTAARERPLFWQWSRGRAVRKGKWKLVAWSGEWQLYDMDNDRCETKDLAASHPNIVTELDAVYKDWLKRCGVKTTSRRKKPKKKKKEK